MICKNCGANIPENEIKCPNCGIENIDETEYISAAGTERVIPKGFSAKKNIIVIIIIAVALLIGGIVTAVTVSNSAAGNISTSETLQLAERYLSEQNYEQAVIEFQKVLEIEPMNVEAYLGLAEAYLSLGETDKAVEALEEGVDKTGDERLKSRLEEIRGELVESITENVVTENVETIFTEPVALETTTIETEVTETQPLEITVIETLHLETTAIETEITKPYTNPSEFRAPENVLIIGGIEYSPDSFVLIGTPLKKEQLRDYTFIKDWCPKELSDLFNNIDLPEFKELYQHANELIQIANIGGSYINIDDGGYSQIQINDNSSSVYSETGYAYDSFRYLFFDVFTDEYAKELLKNESIAAYGGELWHSIGGIGSDPGLLHIEFLVLNQTDSEVEIQQIQYWTSDYDDLIYDPTKKDQYEIISDSCKFVLTDAGWRISKFFPWYF